MTKKSKIIHIITRCSHTNEHGEGNLMVISLDWGMADKINSACIKVREKLIDDILYIALWYYLIEVYDLREDRVDNMLMENGQELQYKVLSSEQLDYLQSTTGDIIGIDYTLVRCYRDRCRFVGDEITSSNPFTPGELLNLFEK